MEHPTAAELPAAPTLKHTLQTRWGMVCDDGRPKDRPLPPNCALKVPAQAPADLAAVVLQHSPLLRANLAACSDPDVTLDELKRYLAHDRRLDIEQAVAMALSVLPRAASARLGQHVVSMLTGACMWRTDKDREVPLPAREAAQARRMARIRQLLQAGCKLEAAPAEAEMAGLLMRVRRARAGQGNSQRLALPDQLLRLLPNAPPQEEWQAWQQDYQLGPQPPLPTPTPTSPNSTTPQDPPTIVMPKIAFARLANNIARLAGDQSPAAQLHRAVEQLVADIEHGGGRLNALKATKDPYALAFSFIARQRRLQLTVVSDDNWTTFLRKDEGRVVLQNRPDLLTSFELALAEMALERPEGEIDREALCAVVTPPGCDSRAAGASGFESMAAGVADSVKEVLLRHIDRTCQLMERYVAVHGGGRVQALRFKVGERGGSGCGPVDVYNALVDVLRKLTRRCQEAGCAVDIAPCYKFLAKDIMQWNDGFGDDAFAPGREVHGWVGWLVARRAAGVVPPAQQVVQCLPDQQDQQEDLEDYQSEDTEEQQEHGEKRKRERQEQESEVEVSMGEED